VLRLFVFLFLLATAILAESNTTLVWPPPPEQPRIAYVKTITKAEDLGIKKGFLAKLWEFVAGKEERKLIKPFGIHHDGERLYVTDAGLKAILIFDLKKGKLEIVDRSSVHDLIMPVDIVTDVRGEIYVTDSMRAVVFKFDRSGKLLKKFGHHFLKRPTGIAYDTAKDRLVVVDTVASNLKLFSTDGKYLNKVGRPGKGAGEFNRPTFIATDDRNTFYVSDSMNHRIQMLDANLSFKKAFGRLGNVIGTFGSPRGVAVDPKGRIYVTDTLFNAVQIFDQDGNVLLAFGSYGTGPGEFVIPEDITITKDGTIYITDSYNMRVQVFKILDIGQSAPAQGGKR